IIKSSPGYDLYVTGSPNHAKSGIQPLTGIIESSWSPYTFTMNWKITERDRIIEFEAGEPFCFFFPVQRNLIEDAEVVTLPVSSDPDIEREKTVFAKARAEHIILTKEGRATESWQKDYFQGRLPSGASRPEGESHRTKLRLRLTDGGARQLHSEGQ